MKLELAERSVSNLPGQLESIGGRNLGQYVEQGSDGSAGGEHGDGVLIVCQVENAIKSRLNPFDKSQPCFQTRGVVGATEPAGDNQFKDTLEFCRVVGGVVHGLQRIRFVRQQARKQGAKHGESIEFVKGRVSFQRWNGEAGSVELICGVTCGVLLALQFA